MKNLVLEGGRLPRSAVLSIVTILASTQLAFANATPTDSMGRCAAALKTLVETKARTLSRIELINEIEKSFVVNVPAGRIGLLSQQSPVVLDRQSAIFISQMFQKNPALKFDDLRADYITLAKQHPNNKPFEWLTALSTAINNNLDAKEMSHEMVQLRKLTRIPSAHHVGYLEQSGSTSFEDLLKMWLLSKQMGYNIDQVANDLSLAGDLFPKSEFSELFDAVIWSYQLKKPLNVLQKNLFAIQKSFTLDTRRTVGFLDSYSANAVTPTLDQALVIFKAAVLTNRSLKVVRQEYFQMAKENQIQEVEQIVSSLRQLVEQSIEKIAAQQQQAATAQTPAP